MPLPRLTRPSLLCLTTLIVVSAGGCGSGGTPIVWQPTLSPAPGTYAAPQSIALSDPLPDARIYYTTDGTEPTTASKRYTGPILIASTTTLEVTAAISGYRNSPALAATYVIAALTSVATPTFTPPAGTYSSPQSIAIVDVTPNAKIFYTTDGSTPTISTTPYTAPIAISSTTSLQAVATAPNFTPSAIATATYTIAALPQTATPTFNPPPGTYTSPQTIQIADATPGASIFYTTDGTTPTASSTPYTVPFTISSTATVNAFATAPNSNPSPLETAVYTIAVTPRAAAPTFNPSAGTYNSPQTIQIADATPNASIFYTTDGTAPTSSSTPYTAPITICSATTIQAIATAAGFAPSPVAKAAYAIGAQPAVKGMWTWMGGSTLADQPPVFGTLGLPSPFNTPGDNFSNLTVPGTSGTFLLFGGMDDSSTTDVRNAMWQYSPSSCQWAWVAGSDDFNANGIYGTLGVSSTASQPPSRWGASGWSAADGTVYVFGGDEENDQPYNDLWTFNPSTAAWTWIGGSSQLSSLGSYGTMGLSSPTNLPAARYDASSCSDNQGNLWMFGGVRAESPRANQISNELWQYSPGTGNWTWYTGSTEPNLATNYPVLGVPGASNTPGGRFLMPCWTDLQGKLWFFGGLGTTGPQGSTYFPFNNDLWSFDPQALVWTWVSGSDVYDQFGVYGTLGQPAPGNIPGARLGESNWIDRSGDLWLFGGDVVSSSSVLLALPANDLWRYSIATNQWTWMGGEIASPDAAPPVYGTLGVPAPGNTPGGRSSAATWTDSQGNFWLFGGYVSKPNGTFQVLSDLWRYTP